MYSMCGECFLKWAKAFHTLKTFVESKSQNSVRTPNSGLYPYALAVPVLWVYGCGLGAGRWGAGGWEYHEPCTYSATPL